MVEVNGARPEEEGARAFLLDEAGGDRSQSARGRAGMYRFLATLFKLEPGDAMLDFLSSSEAENVTENLGVDFLSDLKNRPRPEMIEELATEYARLFIGPGPHMPLAESVQRGENHKGLFWGDETVLLRRRIKSLGLDYREDHKDLPDHISIEFEVMALLAEHEARMLDEGLVSEADEARNVARVILTEHILPWVPDLCDRIVEETDFDYFKALAGITSGFLETEEAEDSERHREVIRRVLEE